MRVEYAGPVTIGRASGRVRPWPGRAVVWSLGFTAVELVCGWLIGRCPWNYRGKRWAINPYIRWDFLPVWAVVGLALEPAHDFLVRLTPAIAAALGGL